MKITPRADVETMTKWRRVINGKRYLFRHVTFSDRIITVEASVWRSVVEGSDSGAWHRVHHIVLSK